MVSGGPYVRAPAAARIARLTAAIDIIEADDIVLAQIAPRLHLDQFERDLAGIGQPMDGAQGDVGRFILVNDALLAVDRHLGGAAYHHPMLGPVHMLLQ